MVQLKKLGGSDLMVPVVCVGTMTWGEQNTKEEAFAQLDLSMSLGANFLDTAELYPVPPREETCGLTEKWIGDWMEARGNRESVIIATKVAGPGRAWINKLRSDPPNPEAAEGRLSREQILSACDASLRRLKTTYIDLYQLHWPDRYAPCWGNSKFDPTKIVRDGISFEEQVSAVGELLKAGKIRAWGLSNETAYGVTMFAETAKRLGVSLPASIQNDFSLVDRRFECETAEACHHYNISLLPYGPLAGGTLTGKFMGGKKPEGARHVIFPNFQPRYHCEFTQAATEKYVAIAAKHDLTPVQVALGFCKSRWYVGSTIIGATKLEQLKENIEALEIDLSKEVLEEIDAVHRERRNPNVSD